MGLGDGAREGVLLGDDVGLEDGACDGAKLGTFEGARVGVCSDKGKIEIGGCG